MEAVRLCFLAPRNSEGNSRGCERILPSVSGIARHVWILVLAACSVAQQVQSSAPAQPATGTVIVSQISASKPNQSYALYLPSHYITKQKWPIVYVFDPDARGEMPVKLMKEAAERYGYIVVGSNNSRNGSWKTETEAAQAMWEDTHAHFVIDDRRIYFAGFSGGARVAAALAQNCKCAAGVLLNGAGFAGVPPSRDVVFPVFSAVGYYDFNYPELSELDEKLEAAGFPHELRHFDGSHQWAPSDVMNEAFTWFELMAMKQNREPRDENFIASQQKEALARAQVLEHSGNAYEAWREYRQARATFDGLSDVAALRQSAASLAQQKAVEDGLKREKDDAAQQVKIAGEIYAGMAAMRGASNSTGAQMSQPPLGGSAPSAAPGNDVSRSEIFHETQQKIISLRDRAASDSNQDRLRVERRALMGVFIAASELGDETLAAKKFDLAKDYYQLTSEAVPTSVGALQDLARAQALDGDRKGSLKTLRRAKDQAKDLATFTTWLHDEPAFAKFRQDPQFQALLAKP
jgi:dienelactone hydrolase